MWNMRYQKNCVYLRSLHFFYIEIQAFLDHSSIANFYQHFILNWMIYNFWKKYFLQKKLASAVTWLSTVSPSNVGFRTNKGTSAPSLMLLPSCEVSYIFFKLTSLTICINSYFVYWSYCSPSMRNLIVERQTMWFLWLVQTQHFSDDELVFWCVFLYISSKELHLIS